MNRTLPALLSALLASCATPRPAPAPDSPPPLRARVDALAAPLLEGEYAPGLAVGVLQGGQAHVFGYGVTSLAQPRPVDGDTVFEIGSVSKVFTGLLLARLSLEGQVGLEDPVASLLPAGVAVPRAGEKEITLAQLATHTSGLPRMPGNFKPADPTNPYADYGAEQLHAGLSACVLASAPGAKYAYSNLGAGLLGHALALRAGRSYEELLREKIAGPLGMASTGVTLSPEQRARLAAGHGDDGRPVSGWDLVALAGAGAIRSTANDLLRFARANLEPGDDALGRALRLAQEERAPREGGAMGLSWHVGLADPRLAGVRWHNGQTGGYHSFLAIDREKGAAVVVLANATEKLVDRLGAALLHLARGEEAGLELPRKVGVAPEKLERLVGTYRLAPEFALTVTREGERLFIQATNQPRLRVWPESETAFAYRVVQATVEFELGEDGRAKALRLFQNGQELPAPRVP